MQPDMSGPSTSRLTTRDVDSFKRNCGPGDEVLDTHQGGFEKGSCCG